MEYFNDVRILDFLASIVVKVIFVFYIELSLVFFVRLFNFVQLFIFFICSIFSHVGNFLGHLDYQKQLFRMGRTSRSDFRDAKKHRRNQLSCHHDLSIGWHPFWVPWRTPEFCRKFRDFNREFGDGFSTSFVCSTSNRYLSKNWKLVNILKRLFLVLKFSFFLVSENDCLMSFCEEFLVKVKNGETIEDEFWDISNETSENYQNCEEFHCPKSLEFRRFFATVQDLIIEESKPGEDPDRYHNFILDQFSMENRRQNRSISHDEWKRRAKTTPLPLGDNLKFS